MALPISWFNLKINDETVRENGSVESSSTSLPIITLTPANVAANETLVGNLRTALQGLILGQQAQATIIYNRTEVSADPAASALAQRENKWLCRYHDATTNQNFQASFGTADLTKKVTNKEYVDLSAGAGLAFKTAFEAIVVSPADASHSVVLDSVTFVGRNL